MNVDSVGTLLRDRAEERGDQDVFFFQPDLGPETSLSYGELDRRARAGAAVLLDSVPAGARALLLYPAGLDFIAAFFACVYAAVIAVPVPPPEPRRPRRTIARLRSVLADARPAVLLATAQTLAGLGELSREIPELRSLRWLATDLVETAEAEGWRAPATIDLAYLQYTSGSTSKPRGVMVSHGNLLANSRAIREAWGYGPDSRSLMWVPNFHDDGLVHGILQPIFSGFPAHLMSPLSVVERPVRWLEGVSRVRATHSGGPNFVYSLCVQRIPEAERRGLDLASWRVAYNAAEPIRPATLEQFCGAFGPCGFRPEAFFPAFGLAEATLLVSSKPQGGPARVTSLAKGTLEREGRAEPADGRAATRLVSCGRVVPEATVAIVDPTTGERLEAGRVGEIWLAGPSVSQGYWDHPEATAETFGRRLAEGTEGDDGTEGDAGPFLRTGDLGFSMDGEIYIAGRLKDTIVVRGRNHYPQDIELTAEQSRPELRPGCGSAFTLEIDGEPRLILVHEVSDRAPLDAPAVVAEVCRAVVEVHDLPVYALILLRPRTIPKTSSGKIQRQACRSELLAGELEEIDSWVLGRVEREPAAATLRHRIAGGAVAASAAARGERDADAVHAGDAADAADVSDAVDLAEQTALGLRTWAAERLNSRLIDERRALPPSVVPELGERGLFGLQVAAAEGGLGLSHAGASRVLEQLGAIDLTLACLVCGHNSLGLRPLSAAPEALRSALLPELARGRSLAAFALSEPGAGSNVRGIASQAVPQGDGWVLRGQKKWIGSASWARVIHVFAQVPGSGLTGFAVQRGAPGLRLGPEALTLGLRGMVQNDVELAGVAVGAGDLLGTVGGGMEVAEDAIALSRLFLGAVAVGGMKRSLQLLTRFAGRRRVATGRLLEHPVLRVHLGEAAAATAAVAALVAQVGRRLDAGRPVPREVLACLKTAAAETLWRTVDHLVQGLGGRGYVESGPAAQMLRDARVFRIFEGPSEVLYQFVGASLLQGRGEVERFVAELAPSSPTAARLGEAAQKLRERVPAGWEATDRIGALRWAYHRAGELTTSALLLAAIEAAAAAAAASAAASVPTGRPSRAVEWARWSFAEAWERALSGTSGEAAALTVAEAEDLALEVATSIGEVEQRLAGEEQGIDPWLSLAGPGPEPAPPAPPAPLLPPPVPSAAAAGPAAGKGAVPTRSAAEIRAWLARWIGHRIGLAPEAVGPLQAFSSLGLDSVTGVQMAADLGTWLGAPVELTAAWDFPSLQALAEHLGGGAAVRGREETSSPAAVELRDLLDDVSGLSDEEAREALQQELLRLEGEIRDV